MDLISLLFSQVFLWIGLPLILICAFCEMAGVKSSSFTSGLINAFVSLVFKTASASIFFLTIAVNQSTRLLQKASKEMAKKSRASSHETNSHYYQEVEVEVVEKN